MFIKRVEVLWLKRTTKLLIVVGFLGFFIFILFVGIKYRTSYAKTEIETLISTDGKFKLTIYEIGEPDWPFGSTHCRFTLYEQDKKINKLDFSIRNDGASAHNENFDVNWEKDYVMIVVSGKEQEDISYYLYFDGRTDSRQ